MNQQSRLLASLPKFTHQKIAVLIAAPLAWLMVLTSGCASITRGTSEAYAVETRPPNAEARSSSGWQCVTPCSVKVKRRSDFVVTITKPGYETVTATVTSSIDGGGAAGMAGNVILGGIIGAGIDAGTGAMHSHKPNPLVVDLVPLGGSSNSTITGTQPVSNSDMVQQIAASAQLRALDEQTKQDCKFIRQVTRGAGGSADTSTNLENAMANALNDAANAGADSYFIVDSATTASGASVVLEVFNCGRDT